jgi:uncharacterized protein (TIGR02646 family)
VIRYRKGTAPRRLTELAATPTMTWAGLGAPDRDPIREALIRDQGSLCAYCERRITLRDDPATGRPRMKIEHWIPRASSTEHHLTWSNLLGVCLGGVHEASASRKHCDESRGDHKLFMHPVDGQGADPREHLEYTQGGEVRPAVDDPRVVSDIKVLNLNARQLIRSRSAVLDALRERLKKSNFETGELRKLERMHRIEPGTQTPEHAELVRYFVRKKLRQKGELHR